MAASSKTTVNSPTTPKHRGWLSTGRKIHVTPSKSSGQNEVYSTSPEKQGRKLHIIPSKSRSHDEMFSTAPAKQMKQVGRNKSEKGKMQINASSHDFGGRNTRWHVSLPNIHDAQESASSPIRRRMAASPLPPPPSNPPPILNQVSDKTSNPKREVKGRELVKSVSAGAVNLITPVESFASQVTKSVEVMEGQTRKKEDGRVKKDPPKLPPPYSPKAKAVAVVSSAIQDHMQSSTRSAPGELQKDESNTKPIETKKSFNTRMRPESTENVLVVSDEIQDKQTRVSKPLKPMPYVPPEAHESQLTSVKSLARYFSARSKEGGNTAVRPVRGRKMFFKGRKETETIKEEKDSTAAKEAQSHRPSPLPLTISEDTNEKYEVLQNVGSVVSTGSPTHMSLFSWYNLGSQCPKHVLDDERLACSDKAEIAKEEKITSPPYKEYLNVSVDTGTLVECPTPRSYDSDMQSDKEGSHKEKKPKPLPRTQSKERAMGVQRSRSQQLSTSNSEGSLSIPSSPSARNSEYVDMTRHLELYGDKKTQDSSTSKDYDSLGIVVQSSLDPDWQESYQEQLEREIEMEEEFSETDTSTHTDQSPDEVEGGGENFGGHSTQLLPFIPVKTALKKTQSHNPGEPNICRRNTPREQRELRKGICSDIDEMEEPEVDEYVSMKSALKPESGHANNTPSQGTSKSQFELSSSLTVSKPGPGMGPNQYLQILPYENPPKMVKPIEQPSTKRESPTHVKHYYIEIDIPGKTEPKKVGIDVSRTPTLNPKSSPAHVTAGAADNTKWKLKYPKIDVGPATDGSRRDERSETKGKTPYTPVKVDSDTSTTPIIDGGYHPTFGKQQSQGTVSEQDLLKRPLPPTPQTAIYYKTVNYPLENIPSTRPVWHQYIEIDESELNKKSEKPVLENVPVSKAAEGWINIHAVGGPVRMLEHSLTSLRPPPVPERPSCPYVEIDGNEMEEWATALPRISSGQNVNRTDSSTIRIKSQTSVGPKVDRKLSTPVPPAVAGKPDLLRRQRSFSNSSDYSYPVVRGLKFPWSKKKSDNDKACFTPSVPLPTTSNPARRNTAGGKKALMMTIVERSEMSDDPPIIPPKTESLLREQGLLLNPSTKPSPYLVPVTRAKPRKMSAPDIYNHLIIASKSPDYQKSQPPKEIVTSLRSELLDERTSKNEDETPKRAEETDPSRLRQRKKAINPPCPPPPKTKKESSNRPPKIPRKHKKVRKEKENGVPIVAITPSSYFDRVPEKEENYETDVGHLHPDTVMVRKGRLQHRIDRNSLEMIIRNKSAIARQLEKESVSQRKPTSPSKEEDESVVRGLGDILLDMDALLQRRMCSEEDLIAAIEKHLSIKLVKKHQSHSDREQGGEIGQADKEVLDNSIKVTEQDVEDVITFMNENQERSEINTDATDSGEDEVSMERGGARRNSVIIKTEVNLGESMEDTDLSPWYQSHPRGEAPEDGLLQSTEIHKTKDSRSSSLGLKPLRRVKARRKSNPSTDNLNMSSSKYTIL